LAEEGQVVMGKLKDPNTVPEPAVREQAREVLKQMNGLQSDRKAMGKNAHLSGKAFRYLHSYFMEYMEA